MASKNKKNTLYRNLNPQTIEYLGLSKQPFADEILSQSSFYNYQALGKISESLTHQIQFSELLLIVEGSHGSGKTSLFRQFIQSDINNTKTLSILAEATDTLVQIQQKMSLHMQDLGDANHLSDNLKSLHMFDQTPLIIMDNAHVLSDITLQELFRYQQEIKQESEVTLKILLIANTGMAETIQKITNIDSEEMYVQHMPEFSAKQVEQFITHKLQNAGYSSEPILNSEDILQIFKKCEKTPLSILNNAAPAIDKIITHKINPGMASWIKYSILVLALIVLIGGGFIAFQLLGSNDNKVTIDNQINPPQPIINLDVTDKPEIVQTLEDIPITETSTDEIMAEGYIEPAEIETNEPIPEPEPEPEVEIKAEPITEIITAPVQQAPKIEEKTLSSTPPSVAKNIKPNTEKTTRKIDTIAVEKKPQLHPALQQLNRMDLHNADYLLQQPATYWTMQLIGAREPQTLLKFAKQHKLSVNSAWYKTQLKDKAYYVLVYGNFTSREKARASLAALPLTLQSLKPWIKSMRSAQEAIKQ